MFFMSHQDFFCNFISEVFKLYSFDRSYKPLYQIAGTSTPMTPYKLIPAIARFPNSKVIRAHCRKLANELPCSLHYCPFNEQMETLFLRPTKCNCNKRGTREGLAHFCSCLIFVQLQPHINSRINGRIHL